MEEVIVRITLDTPQWAAAFDDKRLLAMVAKAAVVSGARPQSDAAAKQSHAHWVCTLPDPIVFSFTAPRSAVDLNTLESVLQALVQSSDGGSVEASWGVAEDAKQSSCIFIVRKPRTVITQHSRIRYPEWESKDVEMKGGNRAEMRRLLRESMAFRGGHHAEGVSGGSSDNHNHAESGTPKEEEVNELLNEVMSMDGGNRSEMRRLLQEAMRLRGGGNASEEEDEATELAHVLPQALEHARQLSGRELEGGGRITTAEEAAAYSFKMGSKSLPKALRQARLVFAGHCCSESACRATKRQAGVSDKVWALLVPPPNSRSQQVAAVFGRRMGKLNVSVMKCPAGVSMEHFVKRKIAEKTKKGYSESRSCVAAFRAALKDAKFM